MPALTTSPWQTAVDRMSSKTIVGSRLRSAEWASVPLALRDRAFFSAGVENARTLSVMREKLAQGLEQARPGGTGMNGARFVADMRNLLGAAPGDSGSLTDLTSVRRLKLIWDFQDIDAHAFASHKASMDPDVMDAFPALRLVRIETRRVPRDWYALWGAAGAKVNWEGASKLVMGALRPWPFWAALSRFGRPWPPFDYGSGMGLEDVDRDEAEAIGLLLKGEDPAARMQRLRGDAATAQQNWNDGLSASIKGLSPEARGWLSSAFGGQISVEGDQVAWLGSEGPGIEISLPKPAVEISAPSVPVGQAPVSKALDVVVVGALREYVGTAIKAIDTVHGDGDLPQIPIKSLTSARALGIYHYKHGGKAGHIAIRNDPHSWPGLTTAHEVGHFIDHQALGAPGSFASVSHEALADFRAVVEKSAAVQRMREIMPAWADFLKPYELWARSYAQFIATRSGNPSLLAQLNRIRNGQQSWRQWSDEDFKPIANAIDTLFRTKGWLK